MRGAEFKSSLELACNYIKRNSKNYLSQQNQLLSVASNNTYSSSLIGDSGASKHCLKSVDENILTTSKIIHNGPKALLPDCSLLSPSKDGHLPIGDLSPTATHSLVYPKLTNASLLSIGQLCDDNCLAIFDKKELNIVKDNKIILKGHRNSVDKLWHIPFPNNKKSKSSTKSTRHSINYIVQRNKNKQDLARYLYATLGSPGMTTLSKAIKNNNLITWPSIEDLNFKDLINTTEEHLKGHLDQERKNLQSTRMHTLDDFFP